MTTLIRTSQAASGVLCIWLCACSGSGAGLDSSGQPLTGSSSGGPVPLSANFDAIQANVFTPICSVCHIGATAPQGLMLDAAHGYNLLVNIPSTEVPSIDRVKPGDPTNSYIIQKIEGHAAVGAQMPLGETPLPASTIAFIVQWITDGAQPGALASPMAASFRIASLAPDDRDVLPVPPAQIVLGFTRELDATRVDTAAVRLERSVGAAGTASTIAVAIDPSVPAANPRALLLTPRAPLMAGDYQIVLSGQPGAGLSASDGQALTALPAADVNGDRIISRFTVAATP
ncbi:MAG: hypothetical protein ACHQDD_01900 [Steroidobacterales bacterium]